MKTLRSAWLLALLLLACAETPPPAEDAGGDDDDPAARPDFAIRYRTRHVDIAPGFTQPVCRGTLDQIDRHVETVAEHLDIELESRPTFYWFNEHAQGTVTERDDSCGWCGNGCVCTISGGEVIYSDIESIFHELTHAVVTPAWGRSDVLFEEGIAHGLDGSHVEWTWSDPPSEVAGGTRHGGAHFSRWLVERFGPAIFRELFERLSTRSTKEEVFAVVEEVYGIPFSELEAQYYATAPPIYPAPGLCDGLRHVPWQGDRWEIRATPDCNSPETFGPRDEDAAMVLAVTLDLPELPPGERFAADVLPGGLGHLTPCIDEPLYDVENSRGYVSDTGVASSLGFRAHPGRFRLTMPFPASGELVVRLCQWNGEWPEAGQPPSLCVPN